MNEGKTTDPTPHPYMANSNVGNFQHRLFTIAGELNRGDTGIVFLWMVGVQVSLRADAVGCP